jgi:hypothetical protein
MKVLVRATVNLHGFPRGEERFADTDVPIVATYLDAGYIVLVNPADVIRLKEGKDADTDAVPVHGPVLEEGAEVEGPDGHSSETGDESNGPDAVGDL